VLLRPAEDRVLAAGALLLVVGGALVLRVGEEELDPATPGRVLTADPHGEVEIAAIPGDLQTRGHPPGLALGLDSNVLLREAQSVSRLRRPVAEVAVYPQAGRDLGERGEADGIADGEGGAALGVDTNDRGVRPFLGAKDPEIRGRELQYQVRGAVRRGLERRLDLLWARARRDR